MTVLPKHFTATAYIFEKEKVLLLFHKKLGKWLPPGGHIEENETPPEAAIREVLEETGLVVEILEEENLQINFENAKSFPRPYLCLLENIPAYKETPAHQHMDFIYLAILTGGDLFIDQDLRWFTLEEMELLKSEDVIFEETKQTLRHLFAKCLKQPVS